MNKRLMILVFTFVLSTGISHADLADGLFGYWPLDGDGTDLIGKKNAKSVKAKFVNDGWRDGAIEVDGAGAHMLVDGFELPLTDAVTVVAWINGWKTIDWSGIVVGRADPATFWMGFGPNDTLTYVWNNNSDQTWNWQGASPIPKEEWAMTAIAIEPKKATSYTYSSKTDKLTAKVNAIAHVKQKIVNLKFGWDECCGARYFKGKIDEVMIFNRTLAENEILQLAKQGLAVDSGGKLATTWATIKQH
ncbi:hypothetical protein HYR99_08480 [Candidatus Poribacteria bacterium]|nr:hypothetical protein [Candidatus Poribacteria bacterium]